MDEYQGSHCFKSKWKPLLNYFLSNQWITLFQCDEPNWAHECLDKFLLPEKIKLRTVFDPNLIEIYYGNKQNHLRTIAEKTGYKLQEMVFFDNQMDNCRDVAQLGVTVAYTPSGVTREAFNKVLEVFPAQNGQMVKVK